MNQNHKQFILTAMMLTLAAAAFGETASDCLSRGLAKNQRGDLDGALADYSKAIEMSPNWAEVYVDRGNSRLAMGDLASALADYNKAIQIKPDLAGAYDGRGALKNDQGDFEGALADYTAAIKLDPGNAMLYKNRAMVSRAKGDLVGAVADYDLALQLKPDFADACNGRGMARKASGDLAGALADYDQAIALDAKNAWSWHWRGCLHYDERDFTNALADFRKELELNPSADYAALRIWLIHARSGQTVAATAELQKYLAAQPAGKSDDWPTKICLYLAGQLDEADLVAAAKNADHQRQAGQLCEAYFYAGSKHLLAGSKADKTVAKNLFLKSIFTNCKSGMEYGSALAELNTLATQKH